jgi:hypothetical protein
MAVKGLKVNSLNMSDDVPGMVLLNTTSFSGVTSVSIPTNSFTSTYENYRIVCAYTNSVNTAVLQARLRAAGSDNTTSNYFNAVQGLDLAAAAQNLLSATQTSWSLMWANSLQSNSFSLDVTSPQKTTYTTLIGNGFGQNAAGGSFTGYRLANIFNATTSFDAMTFLMSTGTMTGKLQVFGYNE